MTDVDEKVVPLGPTKSEEEKSAAIVTAVAEMNKAKLVELATSPGGLIQDRLRKGAWPLLLGVSPITKDDIEPDESWQDLPVHDDEEQVQKDVDRAFIYYPSNESPTSIASKKARLSKLITGVLRTHKTLCYFQGYHDIAAVLLLVLPEQAAFSALTNLSLFRIRDYMLPNIRPTEKHLALLPAILKLADRELAHHISRVPVFYALAGTLTLYAHNIRNFEDITRLYDFLLAHEPVMAIYLFASIVIKRRDQLLSIPADDPDMIHYTLTMSIPQHGDLEDLIAHTSKLFDTYPPESLPGRAWARVPSSSVLKTSRNIFRQQTEKEAEQAIVRQKQLLAREAAVQKTYQYLIRNKLSLISVGSALLAVGLSVWMRKTGHDTVMLATLLRFYQSTWPS